MISTLDSSLKAYNTFGIDAKCRRLSHVEHVDQLEQAMDLDPDVFLLGGGSNMLLTGDLDHHVLKLEINGIKVIEDSGSKVIIEVGAGVVWHDLVVWAIAHDLGGIENLSLIPGTVGAAPIQNIGAYGVELESVFVGLDAYDLSSCKLRSFTKDECAFGYRQSIFKQALKGQYLISHVRFCLHREHELVLTYGAVAQMLEEAKISAPTIKDVSDVIINIRRSKLPDPAEIGNSGSFFKNPVISAKAGEALRDSISDLRYYLLEDGSYKIPAGWMIDQCGWKGYRKGDAGVHTHQALVLVNHGDATGQEILALSREIQDSVEDRFGIRLEPEVNVLT